MTFRSVERSFAFPSSLIVLAAALLFSLTAALPAAAPLSADDELTFEISIKDHKFDPESLKFPAGKRVKLIVKNLDPTPEEFESNDIGFEKIIAGNSQATFRIKPLEPGTYIFFGEFHMDTALGHIVVE